MQIGANSRLAWAIAFASIALWAATALVAFGSAARQEGETASAPCQDECEVRSAECGGAAPEEPAVAEPAVEDATPEATPAQPVSPHPVDLPSGRSTPLPGGEGEDKLPLPGGEGEGGVPLSGGEGGEPLAEMPSGDALPETPAVGASGGEATFRLCGTPDPGVERAIEQLIAGRSFSARLASRAEGCADLTITVPPQSSPGSFFGRQSMNLTVSAGSLSGNPRQRISIHIITENGVTRASIGATQ